MSQRQLHINVNLLGAGTHPNAWRSPGGNPIAPFDIAHYQNSARIAERAKLDAVFLADALNLAPDPNAPPMWSFDTILVLAAMGQVTTHIGLIGTVSSTFSHPYSLARAFLSLDHITGGRAGWNVVTTRDEKSAANFGIPLPPAAERYAAAGEFIEVVEKLWKSWGEGALLADTATGIHRDASRVRPIDHKGRYYEVKGPLQVPRSPQEWPLLVQAGGSGPGRDLAARRADAVFSVAQELSEAQHYYADVKSRARRLGRDPDRLVVLPGLTVVIGGTEEEAHRRRRELDEIAGAPSALERFAGKFGLDPADLDLDAPVPERLLEMVGNANKSHGFSDAALSVASRRDLTIREIIVRGEGGHRQIIGTPEQIADGMELWFREGAADGFNIMNDVYPSGLEAFCEQVIPLLQRRGLFRTEYEETTLRGRYGLL